MTQDYSVFVLEKLKLQAQKELEERVEKHLKDEFYSKWLPKVMKEIRTKLTLDLVNEDDLLDIQIRIKQ